MFFPLSKIFWAIAEPVTLLVILGITGIVLTFTRLASVGRFLTSLAILALALCLLTPVGAAFVRPLEDRFPPPSADMPAPAGIIVLGGSVGPARTKARGQVILTVDGNRLTAGVELARRYPAARLVFSGGSGSLLLEHPPETVGAHQLWKDLGVPDEQMSFELNSRNTWENAVYTRDLVKPKDGETWLLVTSAWHMPRSVGIFRRAGFAVTAYPVAYHTFGDNRDWGLSTTIVDRLFMLDVGIKEWIGLLTYRLTGKTDEFFPGP